MRGHTPPLFFFLCGLYPQSAAQRRGALRGVTFSFSKEKYNETQSVSYVGEILLRKILPAQDASILLAQKKSFKERGIPPLLKNSHPTRRYKDKIFGLIPRTNRGKISTLRVEILPMGWATATCYVVQTFYKDVSVIIFVVIATCGRNFLFIKGNIEMI